jgi:hypothetical protein
MGIFRYVILAITLGCLCLGAFAIYTKPYQFRYDPWPPVLIGGGLLLNLGYVWLSSPSRTPNRIWRLFCLWLDVKEAELKDRVKPK